jgi:hypothetical protein
LVLDHVSAKYLVREINYLSQTACIKSLLK